MEKTKSAYKTIGEVALEIGLRDKKNKKLGTHTLRFWENISNKLDQKFYQVTDAIIQTKMFNI